MLAGIMKPLTSFLIVSMTMPGMSLPEAQTPGNQTVTYIDGNVYRTVAIGKYLWMTENLKTTSCSKGRFFIAGKSGFWWSSSGYSESMAWYRNMIYGLEDMMRNTHPKYMGFSVRCVRDK